MKVLIIDVNYGDSSTGFIVKKTKEYLEYLGNETIACYGRGKRIKANNVFKFGYDLETIIHAFLTRITGYTGCFSFFSTMRLKRIIKKNKPDVIHIHELHGYFVNIISILKFIQKCSIPVVWTFHCEFMYTGKCGHAVECNNYLKECGHCPHLKDYPSSLFFDHTKRMLNSKLIAMNNFESLHIVTPSKWLSDRVLGTKLNKYHISIIHNGIDSDIFHFYNDVDNVFDASIDLNKKVILFVASNAMSDNKGGAFVYEIAKKLSNNFVMVIVGANVKEHSIVNNVHVFPQITDKVRLAKMYSAAFYSLLLSKRETFGFTISESLCCGTKVISFKSGAPETVFFDDNVSFVEYGDVNRIVSIINKSDTYNKEYVSKESIIKYDSQKMCSKYLKLYKELYGEKL